MNCPTCKKRVSRKHCTSATCTWGVCTGCDLVFDPSGRMMAWKGAKQ